MAEMSIYFKDSHSDSCEVIFKAADQKATVTMTRQELIDALSTKSE